MGRAAMDRRSLLGTLAVGMPAAVAGSSARGEERVAAPNAEPESAGAQSAQTWEFFNPTELRAITALVDQLIPRDALGAGGVDAGVVMFMDRQLAGAWGNGLQFYDKGPFAQGTPQQGYQLPLKPADLFRHCLGKIDETSAARNSGKPFADAAPEQQDAMMHDMYEGKFDMAPVASNIFFTQLTQFAFEGFFSDPMYGGNKDMAGWKLVGFPGAYASYFTEIEHYSAAWNRPPISIAQHDALEAAMGPMPGMSAHDHGGAQ